MHPKLNKIMVWLGLTTAICTPGYAWAQQQDVDEPDPNVTVQNRPRPDYDPLGIRAGSFFIFPSLSLSGQYDDNVFATDDNEDSDVGAILAPAIDVNSDWSRHALNFSVGATGAAFYEYQKNNYLDFFAASNGRLDVTRDDIVSGGVRLDRLHEDRDSPDATDTGEDLTEYYRGDVNTQYRHNFARFFTTIGGGVQRLEYDDSASDQNSERRDRNEYGGRLRVGYEVSPRLDVFVQGDYSYRDYDEDQIFQGQFVDKNSHGYRGRVGADVDITGLIFGEAAFGYNVRDYESGELDDVNGWGANGSLTWNVTPLTSIILDLSSEIDETTVEYDGDVATANFQNSAGLDVTHELLRNVLLNANIGYERDEFQGTSRTDNIYSAGGGVTYLINRNLSLNANYRYTHRDSDDDTAEYGRNIVLVGITAKL
jgi:hypothetical protein